MLDESEAVRIAQEHVRKSRLVACEFRRAMQDTERDVRTGAPRPGWVVMFDITNEKARHMDPNEIWIFVDGETGAARTIPLL